MFGYPIPEARVCYWGARAIYKGYADHCNIDLLSDRQTFDGTSNDAFGVWLNRRALPWLRAEVKRIGLSADDPQVIVFREFKYELRATTNKSFGYLYIGAIEHLVTEGEPHYNDAAKKDERVLESPLLKILNLFPKIFMKTYLCLILG